MRKFDDNESLECYTIIDDANRAQYVLALTFSRMQVCLYRPLMHHFLETRGSIDNREEASLYAVSCIRASQNVVSLCEDMNRRRLLNGADYVSMRTLVSQLCTILYVIIVTQGSYDADVLFHKWAVGRKVLDIASKRGGFYGHRTRTLLSVST